MHAALAQQAGTAVIWKGVQLLGRRAVSTLRLLILARILLPEDFGLFSIALVVIETVMSLTDLGMLPAIVQMEAPEPRSYDGAWTVNVVKALVLSALVILLAPLLAELFQQPAAVDLIKVLAFRPLIDSLASVKTAELTRRFQFRRLTFIFLPAIVVEAVVAVMLAGRFGAWALVYGALSGALLCVILSFLMAPYRPRICFDLTYVAPLFQFGRWIFVTKVVAVAGSGVLQVVISRRLGAESLGLYYLAVKLAFLPNDFAAEVVGAVSFPLYARLQLELDRLAKVFRSVLTALALLLVPIYSLLLLLAPAVVEHLLGARWQGSGPIIQALAVVGIIGLFGDAVVPVLQGLGRPYLVAILELFQSVAIIVSVNYLAQEFGAVGAASAWIVAIGPSQLLAAIMIAHVVQRPFAGLQRTLVVVIAGTLAALGAAVLVGQFTADLTGLLLSLFAACLATLAVYVVLDYQLNLGMGRLLKKGFPQAAARLGFPQG